MIGRRSAGWRSPAAVVLVASLASLPSLSCSVDATTAAEIDATTDSIMDATTGEATMGEATMGEATMGEATMGETTIAAPKLSQTAKSVPSEPATDATAKRFYADGLFVSTVLPAIQIRCPESFRYLGRTEFELEGIAHVERHHLIDTDANGEMTRLLVIHFEGFSADSGQTYNYRIPSGANAAGPDFRFSSELVRLGQHGYIHNTWFFDTSESIIANPDRELGHTARLLEQHGLKLASGVMMSRFVRVVDAARSSELIIFYYEPLEPTGFEVSDFSAGGRGAEAFESLSSAVTSRSLAAFTVEDG